MVAGAHRNITNIAPNVRAYERTNAAGQLKFCYDGEGWFLYDAGTASYKHQGARITLAMGLTECCAELGRGMVMHFSKGFYASFSVPQFHEEESGKLPDLLYIDYMWNDEARNEWFSRPHWERLDLLSARGNSLGGGIPVMPINLVYDSDDYGTVRLTEGLPGAVGMMYNKAGSFYYGFLSEMASNMEWFRRTVRRDHLGNLLRGFWQGDKVSLVQYRGISGPAVARGLRQLYIRGQGTSIVFYKDILQEAIQAHDIWATNGGYTMEDDRIIGLEIAMEARNAIQNRAAQGLQGGLAALLAQPAQIPPAPGAVPAPGAATVQVAVAAQAPPNNPADLVIQTQLGTRLLEIGQIINDWDAAEQQAVRDFRAAAVAGVVILTRFTFQNQVWIAIPQPSKELVLEMWTLEQEVAERGDGVRAERPVPDIYEILNENEEERQDRDQHVVSDADDNNDSDKAIPSQARSTRLPARAVRISRNVVNYALNYDVTVDDGDDDVGGENDDDDDDEEEEEEEEMYGSGEDMDLD